MSQIVSFITEHPFKFVQYLIGFIYFLIFLIYVVKPYVRLRGYKSRYGEKVEIYFFPFIGLFWHFARSGPFKWYQARLNSEQREDVGEKMYKAFLKRNPKMHVLISNVGQQLYFFVNDDVMIREISIVHHTKHLKWLDLPYSDIIMKKGMFATSGELWKRQRAFLAPLFTFDALRERVPAMTRASQELVEKFEASSENRKDLLKNLVLCAGDVICRTFFGEELVQAQVGGMSLSENCYVIISEMTRVVLEEQWTQVWGLILRSFKNNRKPYWLLSPRERRLYNRIVALRKFVLTVIEDRKKRFKEFEEEKKSNDFLQVHLRDMLTNDKSSVTDEEILNQFMSIQFAGQDTTAHTLLMGLYLLAKHPEVQDTLRAEIKAKIGQNYESLLTITAEQVKSLEEMDCFVKEVLRFKTPVPNILPRIVVTPHDLGFLQVQKGDMIDINVLGNMTSERHYVNAETFDVGRWKRPEIKNISPYAFTPFHSGPRNCIGQHMIILSHLLMRFRVVPRPGYKLHMMIKTFYEPEDDYVADLEPLIA